MATNDLFSNMLERITDWLGRRRVITGSRGDLSDLTIHADQRATGPFFSTTTTVALTARSSPTSSIQKQIIENMRQTGSSSRGTKAAKTEPDEKTDVLLFSKRESSPTAEVEDANEKLDFEFEELKDANHELEPTAPKRKRAHTSQATTTAPHKKQIGGKQGRLEGLMKMPVDIFTETVLTATQIALNLMPEDIISLTRANKFFRTLLMTKSSIHIWRGAMRNVPGIPACPPDLSEPHYLALIYAPDCSMCGTTSSRRMDEMLRVRLCPSCRSEHLIKLSTVMPEIIAFVPSSNKIVPSKRRRGGERYALKSDVQEVQAEWDELEKTGDTKMLEERKDTRKRELQLRSSQARALIAFLDGLENDRRSELQDLKNQHRLAVNERLLESGWDKDDLVSSYSQGREWSSLVDQAEVLTDRAWVNLQPKLIPLLEVNREDRLKREKSERKCARQTRLEAYLKTIKEEKRPIIDVTVPPLAIPGSNSASPDVQIKYMGIFPKFIDALEWDQMKGFLENDISVADMEEQVSKCLPDITRRIDEWINDIEGHLVELLRKGREADNLGRDIPDASLSVSGASSSPLENATGNEKILLRADSLFESSGGGARPPLVYDAAVLSEYTSMAYLYPFTYGYDRALDMSKLKPHTEAQKAARKILAHIGKPDATVLEMRTARQVYRCGRCHDRKNFSWEGIVNHFVLKQQYWESMQKRQSELEKGITFRNVHDPAFITDKPMIKLLTQNELLAEVHEWSNVNNDRKMCKVCSRAGISPEVQTNESGIIAHLTDV
ncbi:hypothetical protein FRC09_012951 [Ceratobasidium sp. 395]|nr:hypothetical protein FRC09_012951 [Ceratobasidium sp. 395]